MAQVERSSLEYISQSTLCVEEIVKSSQYLDPATGYISQKSWNDLVKGGVLAAALHDREPKNRRIEHMEIIRGMSREAPPFGLMYGIMVALVIDNFYKFASTGQRDKYFDSIRQGQLCGFAFTERDLSGSSLGMDSSYTENSDGTITVDYGKRWQGISGHDLLVFALNKNNPSVLKLFLVEQKDNQTEYIKTEGLKLIPYAYNSGHVILDTEHQLAQLHTRRDLGRIQQIFTDSRLGFPGMSLGQLERLERSAREYAEKRLVGAAFQKDMAVPQDELGIITARRIVVQAMYDHSIDFLDRNPDTLRLATEGNMIKALSTEYAFLAALTTAKLGGGDSFKTGTKWGDTTDLWPFTIFEGNNDMLFSQVGRSLARSPLYGGDNQEGLFNRVRAAKNLTKESKSDLDWIATTTKSPILEKIWGEIAARCFALGCLDNAHIQAVALLNLEIQQLGLKYRSQI